MQKLPVLSTVSEIYARAFGNLNTAFALAWPWLAVLAAIYACLYWAGIPVNLDFGLQGELFTWQRGLALLLIAIVYAYGFAAIAVGWHRHQILGEAPKGLGILNFDERSWRYLWVFIGIILLLVLAYIPIGIVVGLVFGPLIENAMQNTSTLVILGVISFIVLMIVGAYLSRLLMRLVAVALGNSQHTMSYVWNASKGNIVPLVFVNLLVQLPLTAVEWFADYMYSINGEAAGPVWTTLSIAASAVSAFVGIVMLTKLYDFFVLSKES